MRFKVFVVILLLFVDFFFFIVDFIFGGNRVGMRDIIIVFVICIVVSRWLYGVW